MRRRHRQFVLALAMLVGVGGGVLGGLLVAVRDEPSFYTTAMNRSADWETHERAARLLTRVQDLKTDIRQREIWGDSFTADDLNCFFAENMGPKGGLRDALPQGFHSPRIAIEGDRLKLGVRYGQGWWSAVVWLELKVWLVADQVNVAAVEVVEMRAGRLGFGSQTILDMIADLARGSSIDVTWYRQGSNPIGLFKFFAKQSPPMSQVLTLEVKNGKIVIAGRSILPGRMVPAGATPATER